jgi:uncharacterized caspase-like protein
LLANPANDAGAMAAMLKGAGRHPQERFQRKERADRSFLDPGYGWTETIPPYA